MNLNAFKAGPSGYAFWSNLPENKNKTQAQYIEYLLNNEKIDQLPVIRHGSSMPSNSSGKVGDVFALL